jgi:hypothetical protein
LAEDVRALQHPARFMLRGIVDDQLDPLMPARLRMISTPDGMGSTFLISW